MSLTFDVEEFCYVEMSSACSCIEPASCFFAPTLSRAIVSAVTTRLANHQLVFAHTAKNIQYGLVRLSYLLQLFRCFNAQNHYAIIVDLNLFSRRWQTRTMAYYYSQIAYRAM